MNNKDLSFYINLFVGIALVGVICTYIFFFSFLDSSYSPYYGDEFFYFKNSENFEVHSTLKAAFTYSGQGSVLLGADAHGPAYPLLYGLISKITGWHSQNILVINFSLLLMAILALVTSKKISRATKSQQVLLVAGCPVTLFYSFTFLPELLHVAGAIGFFLLFQKYLKSTSFRDFVGVVACIVILGIFRSTWFFAFIGLIAFPPPFWRKKKWLFGLMAVMLPFLFQYFFHEQVPNAYSETGNWIADGQWAKAIKALLFNTKRNLYFLLTYTEGWYYTLQKIWLLLSLIFGALYFRKDKIVQFGMTGLILLIVFNFVFYKNYDWVDLRMYTPWILFLNLSFVQLNKSESKFLVGLNLASFVLILPFLYQLLDYRTHPTVLDIPKSLQLELKQQQSPILIHLNPEILDEYALTKLPIVNDSGEPIRYILPYYELETSSPTLWLRPVNGQLRACPKNSLCQ